MAGDDTVVLERVKKVKEALLQRLRENEQYIGEAKNLIGEINALFAAEFAKYCEQKEIGKLKIVVIEARDIPKMDKMGKTDGYVIVEVGFAFIGCNH